MADQEESRRKSIKDSRIDREEALSNDALKKRRQARAKQEAEVARRRQGQGSMEEETERRKSKNKRGRDSSIAVDEEAELNRLNDLIVKYYSRPYDITEDQDLAQEITIRISDALQAYFYDKNGKDAEPITPEVEDAAITIILTEDKPLSVLENAREVISGFGVQPSERRVAVLDIGRELEARIIPDAPAKTTEPTRLDSPTPSVPTGKEEVTPVKETPPPRTRAVTFEDPADGEEVEYVLQGELPDRQPKERKKKQYAETVPGFDNPDFRAQSQPAPAQQSVSSGRPFRQPETVLVEPTIPPEFAAIGLDNPDFYSRYPSNQKLKGTYGPKKRRGRLPKKAKAEYEQITCYDYAYVWPYELTPDGTAVKGMTLREAIRQAVTDGIGNAKFIHTKMVPVGYRFFGRRVIIKTAKLLNTTGRPLEMKDLTPDDIIDFAAFGIHELSATVELLEIKRKRRLVFVGDIRFWNMSKLLHNFKMKKPPARLTATGVRPVGSFFQVDPAGRPRDEKGRLKLMRERNPKETSEQAIVWGGVAVVDSNGQLIKDSRGNLISSEECKILFDTGAEGNEITYDLAAFLGLLESPFKKEGGSINVTTGTYETWMHSVRISFHGTEVQKLTSTFKDFPAHEICKEVIVRFPKQPHTNPKDGRWDVLIGEEALFVLQAILVYTQ